MRPLALLVLTTTAIADDGVRRESIVVGQTIERAVGYAIGVACDHPDVVTAEMKTKPGDTNVLVLSGKRAGTTTCRAGTDPYRPSYVFAITVRPKPARR